LWKNYCRTSRKWTNNSESCEPHGVWEARTVQLRFTKFTETWYISHLTLLVTWNLLLTSDSMWRHSLGLF
jgi:hypothetical protein